MKKYAKIASVLVGLLAFNMFSEYKVMAKPKTQEKIHLLKDLGSYKTYNSVSFGNHTVEKADVEGKVAVKGNFIGPTASETRSFDIAAAYEGNTNITGEQILDKSNPVFLLGGDALKENGKEVNVLAGVGVTKNEKISNKFTVGIGGLGLQERSENEILSTFEQIKNDINEKINSFSNVKVGVGSTLNHASAGITESLDNPRILVNKERRDLEIFDVNGDDKDVFRIPNLDNYDAMIIYSNAKIINFNHNFFYEGISSPIDSKNPIMKKIAHKIIWVFPNATTINQKAIDVIGSVVAPNAILNINGGAYNGQVYANEIDQKGGGQIHNFLFNWDVVDNLLPKGQIEIIKKSEDGVTLLPNAEFEIIYEDGSTFKKITDGEGKLVFENLLPGKYVITETKAPEGFELNELNKFEFEITKDNLVVTKTIENKKIVKPTPLNGRLVIEKIDAADGKALEGAEFEVYKGKAIVGKGTTNKEGKLDISNL
ncbi:MAG: collagen-binding domain-containing protein, partial [Sarcina sp.]